MCHNKRHCECISAGEAAGNEAAAVDGGALGEAEVA
jgi:hypothetical protein